MTAQPANYPVRVTAVAAPSPFRHFLWSRFAGQTALNALLYGLLIVVVERSGSSLGSTLLVVAFVVPSIVLGVPGGALADALPKRPVLVVGLLLRAVVALALLWWAEDLGALYLLVLALATVGQVFGPAEAAFVPDLLPRERLARGNAAMQLVLLAAQVLGGVALAPLLLKVAGARPVFAFAAGLFLVAAWQMVRVRRAPGHARAEEPSLAPRTGRWSVLAAGWRATVDDPSVLRALVRLTLVGAVLKILVAVAPILARDVLDIAAANTVYVMAPAALGSALGLLLAPPLSRLLGRVFATQLAIADAASLPPLLAAGAVADLVGVNPVLFGAGFLCLIMEVAARRIVPARRNPNRGQNGGWNATPTA